MKLLLNEPKAKIGLLGSFHFSKPGIDYVPENYHFDTMSEQRQLEIAEVVHCLTDFKPTKIAIETNFTEQKATDKLYGKYRANDASLSTFEGHQLGFGIANILHHETVYAVDSHQTEILSAEEGEQLGNEMETIDPVWMEKFLHYTSEIHQIISTKSLRKSLKYMNEQEVLRNLDTVYYKLTIKAGGNESFLGAGWMTEWFNRNLRIFRNIQRIVDSPNDRVLVIFGTGHIPILNYLFNSSPEFEVIDITTFLE